MAFKDPFASLTQQTHILWRLDRPMIYQGNYEIWEVPEGYITDLASVPRLAVWLIPRYGVYTPAAILHDYFCDAVNDGAPIVSRADADGLFRRCLRELGVSGPKRWMMWAAVRAASRMSGAKLKDWLWFLLILVPAVTFVAIPAIVVQIWVTAFWAIEWFWWTLHRVFQGEGNAPEKPVFPTSV